MTPLCRVCERTQIVKKGANRCGNTQHHGKDCGASGVLKPKPASWQTEHHTVLRVCRERRSLRGVTRLFALARQTGARWLTTHVQNLPEVKASLLPAAPEEVLDLEEMWRGVRNKEQARWVWTAMCRRSRHIVALVIGDRSPRDLPSALASPCGWAQTLPPLQ